MIGCARFTSKLAVKELYRKNDVFYVKKLIWEIMFQKHRIKLKIIELRLLFWGK